MSVIKEPTLSMIMEEETERSQSDRSSRYEPVVIPETSRYSANYSAAAQVPRASIFSSETSYGEPLPPDQSTFKTLGLGVSLPQIYDKSLPSLPSRSVAKSTSARSMQKTESVRGSVAKSDSSRHSIPKSESSKRSLAKPDSSRQSLPKPESSRHSAPRYESSRHSSVKSESAGSSRAGSRAGSVTGSVASESVTSVPPPVPSKASSLSSISSVTTHSSTQSSSVSSASTQSTLRTFDDVVDEVASSLALRTKMRAETVATSDQTKIGVCTTMSRTDDQRFLRILAAKIHYVMALQSSYLFALVPSLVSGPLDAPATLVFCGAPQRLVTKACILAGLRFKTRLAELQDNEGTWIGYLEGHPAGRDNWDPNAQDEDVLWDVVRKAANPVDPAEPPPGSRSVDQVLAEARRRLDRLSPREAFAEAIQDGMLVDIRPAAQRAECGSIPGAIIIERNVLEWRFDPRSVDGRLPIADRYDLRVIVYCQEGYTSSLAASALQDIGLWRATDINGGFARWKEEGFPVRVDTHYVDHRPASPDSAR